MDISDANAALFVRQLNGATECTQVSIIKTATVSGVEDLGSKELIDAAVHLVTWDGVAPSDAVELLRSALIADEGTGWLTALDVSQSFEQSRQAAIAAETLHALALALTPISKQLHEMSREIEGLNW